MTTPFQATQVKLFQPTSITGCQLWLDAADSSSLTISGSNVSQWNDKSGNGRNATQATGSNQPTYTPNAENGLASITFTNPSYNANYMSIPSFILSAANQISVFVVLRFTSSFGGSGDFFIHPGDYTVFTMTTFPGSANFAVYVYNGSALFTGFNATNTTNILSLTYNGATTTPYVNGTAYSTRNDSGSGLTTSRDLRLGGYGWNGYISEVLWYRTSLSTSQRQQVEGYLAWKWGLQTSLPASHPYRNTPVYTNPPFPLVPFVKATTNSAVFNPTNITGCSLWLDATDNSTILLSGSSVTSVRDKAQSIVFTTQGTSSFLTVVSNSIQTQQALYFNNTSAENVSLLGTYAQPSNFSMFVVWRNLTQRGTSGYRNIIGWQFAVTPTPGAFNFGYPGAQTGGTVGIWDTWFGSIGTLLNVSNSTNYIGYSQYGSPSLSLNGNTPSSTSLTVTSGASNLYVGGAISLNGTVSMYLGEVIIYNSILTTQQRQQVEGYLAWKWGLTANLPNGHPYKTPPIAPFSYQLRRAVQNKWLPTNLTGCSLWYDAADTSSLVQSNSFVTSWTSKGSNAILLTNASAYPSYVSNVYKGYGILRFNSGVNQALSNASVANSVAQTNGTHAVFIVHNPTANNSTPFAYVTAAAGNRISVVTPEGSTIQYDSAAGRLSYSYASQAAYLNGNLRLETLTVFGGSRYYRRDGTQLATNAAGTPSYNATQILYLGGAQPSYPGYAYGGDYCEIVWYNIELSIPQIQQVEGYLAWKWGLQRNLPANHPYAKFPPSP